MPVSIEQRLNEAVRPGFALAVLYERQQSRKALAELLLEPNGLLVRLEAEILSQTSCANPIYNGVDNLVER